MKCPVDDAPAKDITKLDYDGRSVRCPSCGDYDIAGGYEAKLAALDLEDRIRVLNKARAFATPGTRPCITKTCFY